jgi:ferredoxin/flavodoxin---NADP+ reductase
MKILRKEILASSLGSRIIRMEVLSEHIAQKAMPGQFVVLMAKPEGERIPLTIVNADKLKGTITLIFQEAGLTTRLLGMMEKGDSLSALVGPLGHPTEVRNFGRVIILGGGVGIAEIYPVAAVWRKAGNQVTTILGARTKELLILEKELKSESNEFYVATDDGSYGRKGFNADILKELLGKNKYDLVYAVGPIPMMKIISSITREYNLKTIVSLNALMVDGTGMCGCCRVSVGSETKFSCVDGPDFDGHLVDWDGLISRNRMYQEKEKHACKLNLK